MEKALVVFESPSKPILGEFIDFAIISKDRDWDEGSTNPIFQAIKNKSLPTSKGREEQGAKGKLKIL